MPKKTTTNLRETIVDQAELSAWLNGLNVGTIRNYVNHGIIPRKSARKYNLFDCVNAYITYKSEQKRDNLDRRKKELECEKLEIHNTKAKGEVIPVQEAVNIVMQWNAALNTELTQLLEIEWPVATAGKEIAEIREAGKTAKDNLCARLQDTIEKLQDLEFCEESEEAGPDLIGGQSTSGRRTTSRSRVPTVSRGGSRSKFRATSSTSSKRSNQKRSVA